MLNPNEVNNVIQEQLGFVSGEPSNDNSRLNQVQSKSDANIHREDAGVSVDEGMLAQRHALISEFSQDCTHSGIDNLILDTVSLFPEFLFIFTIS